MNIENDNNSFILKIKHEPKKETGVSNNQTIHFNFDWYQLQNDQLWKLNKVVKHIKEKPNVDVIIKGFTDSKGTEEYNLILSKKRAETVKNYLIEKGIKLSKLQTLALGENDPVYKCIDCSAEQDAENRRVIFEIRE